MPYDIEIPPHTEQVHDTLLCFDVFPNHGEIYPKSQMMAQDVDIAFGKVDPNDYGSVKIKIKNQSNQPFQIKRGTAVSQLIIKSHIQGVIAWYGMSAPLYTQQNGYAGGPVREIQYSSSYTDPPLTQSVVVSNGFDPIPLYGNDPYEINPTEPLQEVFKEPKKPAPKNKIKRTKGSYDHTEQEVFNNGNLPVKVEINPSPTPPTY